MCGASSRASTPRERRGGGGGGGSKEPEGGRGPGLTARSKPGPGSETKQSAVPKETEPGPPPASGARVPESGPSPLNSSQCSGSKPSRRRRDGLGLAVVCRQLLHVVVIRGEGKKKKRHVSPLNVFPSCVQAAEAEPHDPAACGVCERQRASLAFTGFIRRKKTQLQFQTLKARLNTHLGRGVSDFELHAAGVPPPADVWCD